MAKREKQNAAKFKWESKQNKHHSKIIESNLFWLINDAIYQSISLPALMYEEVEEYTIKIYVNICKISSNKIKKMTPTHIYLLFLQDNVFCLHRLYIFIYSKDA